MSFKLTQEHVDDLLSGAAVGDWSKFLGAMDPELNWVVFDPTHDETSLSGTYNLKSWQDKIGGPLRSRLVDGKIAMKVERLYIVGNRVIFESSGTATQNNGRPYNNRWAWFVTFSEQTGKIVDIQEYANSALVREVMTTN